MREIARKLGGARGTCDKVKYNHFNKKNKKGRGRTRRRRRRTNGPTCLLTRYIKVKQQRLVPRTFSWVEIHYTFFHPVVSGVALQALF